MPLEMPHGINWGIAHWVHWQNSWKTSREMSFENMWSDFWKHTVSTKILAAFLGMFIVCKEKHVKSLIFPNGTYNLVHLFIVSFFFRSTEVFLCYHINHNATFYQQSFYLMLWIPKLIHLMTCYERFKLLFKIVQSTTSFLQIRDYACFMFY